MRPAWRSLRSPAGASSFLRRPKTPSSRTWRSFSDSAVRTWEISVDDAIEEHLPGLNPDGIGRVAYEPDGGFADPHLLCQGFVDGAMNAGANVYVNTPVTGITMSGDRVTGVSTPNGDIASPIVVNAAGPWAGPIGLMAGLDLPLEISREQEMMLQVPCWKFCAHNAPSPIWSSAYTSVPRSSPAQSSSAWATPRRTSRSPPDDYDRRADPDFIEDAGGRLAHRLPHLADAEVIASWAGLYTITPDWSMIVDRAPGVDGMYLAVGGSGHSFKLAPAIGQCLAEMIATGSEVTVDITPLRATRFSEGDPLRSTYGGNRG